MTPTGRDRFQRKTLLAELKYMRLSSTISPGDIETFDDQQVLATWTAQATLDLTDGLHEEDSPQRSGARGHAIWDDEDIALEPAAHTDGEPLVIARSHGWLLNLDAPPGRQVEALEEQSSSSAEFLELIMDVGDGRVNAELDDVANPFGGTLFLIDRAEVAPAWRHAGGVGRLLLGRSWTWLARDAALMALVPFPLQHENKGADEDPDLAVLASDTARVEAVWASLGFEQWKDRIWIASPASSSHEGALATLERSLGLR